jgi:hypothetical protein
MQVVFGIVFVAKFRDGFVHFQKHLHLKRLSLRYLHGFLQQFLLPRRWM